MKNSYGEHLDFILLAQSGNKEEQPIFERNISLRTNQMAYNQAKVL